MQPEGRNEAFQGGATSTGLQPATSMQQHVDPMFHPDSVLNVKNGYPSADGMSMKDYGNVTYGGRTPNQNGMSSQTREAAAPLMSTFMNV